MTPLQQHLLSRISATGPISVADYMAECLLHPEWGYYTTRQPFGETGDFTTAPEISQMFGEMVGLSLAQAWLDQGASSRFVLAELGPGRGTLMADILRATSNVPGFHDAGVVTMVEASPKLRATQKQTIAPHDARWLDNIDSLPADLPLFLVANEFFDALPIRQFRRTGQAWQEVQVGAQEGKLHFGLAPQTPLALLQHRLADTAEGDIVELCPMAAPIMRSIGERLLGNGGAALIFDYGDWRSLGDTLQAVKHHEYADILENCGQADLTAHVDFEALTQNIPDKLAHQYASQGAFLEHCGIVARAQRLASTLSGPKLDQHISAFRRLTHPDEMGSLFKVLAICPNGAPGLAGFADDT